MRETEALSILHKITERGIFFVHFKKRIQVTGVGGSDMVTDVAGMFLSADKTDYGIVGSGVCAVVFGKTGKQGRLCFWLKTGQFLF